MTGTNIPSTPTDNPQTPAPNDPTVTIIVVPPILPPTPAVPALNEWDLLILTFTLLSFGVWTLKRRTA